MQDSCSSCGCVCASALGLVLGSQGYLLSQLEMEVQLFLAFEDKRLFSQLLAVAVPQSSWLSSGRGGCGEMADAKTPRWLQDCCPPT
jgi:hypothetical protein